MINAYSYIRMSTMEQLHGDSARRQKKLTDEYVKNNGLRLVDIFHDRGISAFKGKNAEMGRLFDFLELVEKGEIEVGSYLIVESLDRITRANIFDAVSLLNKIVQSGIIVVTMLDGQKYSKESCADNSMGMMFAAILLMRGHEESLIKSKRLSAAWQNKRDLARKGQPTKHVVPNWMRFAASGDAIVLIQERADIIKTIFEMSRDGWGCYSIAKNLNDRLIPTWGKAEFWQESYVKKLLSNRAVIGEYQPYRSSAGPVGKRRLPDGEPIQEYYPRVIDDALFQEANLAIQRRRLSGKGRKGASFSNLFSGLLKCKYCKSGMRYENKGQPPKGGQYVRCSRAVLTRKCRAPAFRYGILEEQLINLLKDLNFEAILNGPDWVRLSSDLRGQLVGLESESNRLQQAVTNLTTSIAAHGFSEALSNLLRSSENELTQVHLKQNAVASELADLSSATEFDCKVLIEKLGSFESGSPEQINLRRKLSDEIRKSVTRIMLGQTFHIPADFEDIPEIYNLDHEHFFDPNRAFELTIVFKNGVVETFDSLTGEHMHFTSDERMSLFKNNLFIKNLA